MIEIKSFVYNPFQENTYILADPGGACLIVDAGCHDEAEKSEITGYISENGLQPVALVNTHCHIDHILGISFLSKEYKIPFLIHQAEEAMLKSAVAQGEFFGIRAETPPSPDVFLKEGTPVRFGNSSLEVLHVPGHSRGKASP